MDDDKGTSNHIDYADEQGPEDVYEGKGAGPPMDLHNPKNWPLATKITTYMTICCFTFLANVNSSNFTVATKAIVSEFHVSSTDAGHLVSLNVFFFGLGNLAWVPLMRVFGKRPVYLAALLCLSMMNVWSAKATGYSELLGARIMSGLAAAAADATVPAVVADMVLPEGRGHWLMIFHLALTSGLFVGPLINAYIVQDAGWRWMCWFLAIASGVVWLVGVVTIRETTYLPARQNAAHRKSEASYWSTLSLRHGYNPDASFLRTVKAILSAAAYPQLLWCAFTIGVSVGWNIVVQLTASHTFTSSPYNWPAGDIGLLSLAGFIGSLLAFYVGGRLIDQISTRYTRRRGGERQPEYRLPALIVPGLVGPVGILIFGLCIAHRTHWMGVAVGYAMQAFGVAAISNVAVTYALDCYHRIAGEALVIIFVIRNTIGMLLSLYASDWIARQGVAVVFGEMTAIEAASLLLAVPLFFFGMRLRAVTRRYGPNRGD
ncbi:MFS general substrate transporter [Aspergillus homomorphus CBS 101889]|uniref:MFS general substrate transporter n=1 Tax=Aspergillus homomorphus (strain CBS 101889) TaxID=1450537 RepID=A0A395I2L1_ASPHC|nr:MFS general substrate transporter [Aspergillus homomorphus CBS 101889]RAL13903.1 MFS general substrate transporter [Aspergillus homomorphus CBS 101889]